MIGSVAALESQHEKSYSDRAQRSWGKDSPRKRAVHVTTTSTQPLLNSEKAAPEWSTRVVDEYRDLGYTVIRGFFSPEDTAVMLSEVQATDIEAGDRSAGTMVFLNNVFRKSERIRDQLSQPAVVDLVRLVSGPDFWIRWDQAVLKGPGAPRFPWHQDNGYSNLKGVHQQVWIALTRMSDSAGGLWVVPGSHKAGRLPHRQVGNQIEATHPVEGAVLIEAEPGDVVLFSSLTLHYTGPNTTSDLQRWAYVVEFMSTTVLDPFNKGPYFSVARNGRPDPRYVRTYAAQWDLRQHATYLVPQAKRVIRKLRKKTGLFNRPAA